MSCEREPEYKLQNPQHHFPQAHTIKARVKEEKKVVKNGTIPNLRPLSGGPCTPQTQQKHFAPTLVFFP